MIADKFALRGWLARRQLSFEGGFSGRANKLVDGCYSFWQGACMALLNIQFSERSTHEENMEPYLSHGIARSVEEDFLTAKGEEKSCEQPLLEQSRDEGFQLLFDQYKLQRYILLCAQEPSGGLRDKPSKPRDFYHTCYNLSGLSVSQHVLTSSSDHKKATNIVKPTHPALNLRIAAALFVIHYFKKYDGSSFHCINKHDELLQQAEADCKKSAR